MNTPVYRSELVNRTKLSVPIVTARKNFIRALFEKWQHLDLDFPAENFPPEKTIYLSLLQDTGIHRQFNGEYALMPPRRPRSNRFGRRVTHFCNSRKVAS